MFRKIGLFLICGLLTAPAAFADPDLPGATANLETIPSGSLIIPMDTVHQTNGTIEQFNNASYGLANKMLQNNIPIKWAMRASKVKLRRVTTGPNNSTSVIDNTVNYVTAGVIVGDMVTNVSKNPMTRSRVTAVAANILTVTAIGGDPIDFDTGDIYIVDGHDFTATAERIRPGVVVPATSVTFSGAPFIVSNENPANVAKALEIMLGQSDGFPPVLPQFNANAAQTAVRVFRTTTSTSNVDIRYSLTHKPFAAVSDVNTSIHTSILVEAGIPGAAGCIPLPGQPGFNPNACNWNVINPVQLADIECATIHLEPHRATEDQTTVPPQTPQILATAVENFVRGGGNFVAQCHSVQYFENNNVRPLAMADWPGNFMTSQGIDKANDKNEQSYPNGPMPFNQFTGPLDGGQTGSIPDWNLNGGAYSQNNAYVNSVDATNAGVFKAATAKLPTGGNLGGVVMYLGGHEYTGTSELEQINGRRMILNALFIPPDRPQNCGLTINGSLIIQKRVINNDGGALGVNAFGVTTSAGALTFDAGVAEGGDSTLFTAEELTVQAGQSYTLIESDVAAYDEGTWTCTSDFGDTTGGGAFNSGSVVVQPGDIKTCVIDNDDSLPNINLAKTAGVVQPLGGNDFRVVYTITATNNGAGAGIYDLNDTFNGLPTGVTVTGGPTPAYAGGESQTQSFGAFPLFIDDEPLAAGATENWTVTVDFTVNPETLPDANRACVAQFTSGNGFYNLVAAIPGENPNDNDACVDIPTPSINLAKTAGAAQPQGGNVFRVIYTITATNSGVGPGIYDLNDTFNGLPAGVTVSSGPVVAYAGGETQTKTVGAAPLFVDDEPLAGGNASESWTVTVDFTVDPGVLSSADRICAPNDPGEGKGFYNMVAAIPAEDPTDNDGCVNIPGPSINLAKSAGAATPIGGSVFQVIYTVTATNSGDGPGLYDLNDTFDGLPTGVTVTNGPIVVYAGGETQTQGVGASPLFVDDEPLAGGNASESWTITVQFTVDAGALDPDNRDCEDVGQVAGKGFYNLVAAIPGEDPEDNDACVDIPAPAINLAKSAGAVNPLGGNVFEVVYTVTATNSGVGPGTYDLNDTFDGLPTGVTVTNGPVVVYAGGESQTKTVGASPLFVDDEPLAGGNASESWTITVQFTVDAGTLPAEDIACDAQGAPGNGFYNRVATIPGEDPEDNDACVDIPPPAVAIVDKTVTNVMDNNDGTFDVSYKVLVSNTGGQQLTYDLEDTLAVDVSLTPTSIVSPVAYMQGTENDPGGTLGTPAIGDFLTGATLVSNETLQPGLNEAFTFTLRFDLEVDLYTAEGANCTFADGENGTGFTNNVSLLVARRLVDEDSACAPIPQPPEGEDRATFTVQKQFMDGNDITDVTFRIDCNTGLILDQVKTTHINPGPLMSALNFEVEFVVTDFTQGNLTCEVWEDPLPTGYTPSYDCDSNTLATCDSGEPSDLDEFFEGPCIFSNVDTSEIGDDPWQHLCMIRNYPDPVPVVVTKDWVIDGMGGDYIDPWYKLTLTCENEIITSGAVDEGGGIWSIMFINSTGTNDAQYTAWVIPDWDGGTSCSVYESGQDQAIEVGNGCQNLLAQLADGDECTITNTVFFEGIPTLNQYGIALLALLMMGMGLVSFRRFS